MPAAPEFWWRSDLRAAAAGLWPASRIWGAVAAWRIGRRPVFRPPVPVFCVGNFVVGGAGKTPTALAIVRVARSHGLKPGILASGYGGRLKRPTLVDGKAHGADDVGDEALLLARAAPTVVAAERAAGARRLLEEDVDIIVMDDGFQNPSLAKDLSLIAVDAGSGIGNGRMVPAGPLRAPLNLQLRRADGLLVIGQGDAAEPLIRVAARAGRPVMRGKLQPTKIRAWRRQPILAFAGIGRPQKFFDSLRAIKADVAQTREFADHHVYRTEDADELLAAADADGLRLVTTEKDLVRLAGRTGSLGRLHERSDAFSVTLQFDNPMAATELIEEALRRFSATTN